MISSMTKTRTKIEDAVPTEFDDFLTYCANVGKVYIDEIVSADYDAYHSLFGRGKEDIKTLCSLINSAANDYSAPIQISPEYFAVPDNAKRSYEDILALNSEDYSDISVRVGDVSIFTEALSARVLNGINRSGCFTLEDLLQKTHNDLCETRNIGEKSVREIELEIIEFASLVPQDKRRKTQPSYIRKSAVRSAVETMLSGEEYSLDELYRNEKKYFKIFTDAADKAGSEFCVALLDTDKRSYIKLILDTLSGYRCRQSTERGIIESAKSTAAKLDAKILDKSLALFMRLCSADAWLPVANALNELITPDTRVSEYAALAEALLTRSNMPIDKLELGLSAFEGWLKGATIEKECEKLFECKEIRDARAFEALYERSEGPTLAEIAERHGLTRERVRQLEKKAATEVCQRIRESAHNIFGLIFAYRDGDCILRKDDITDAAGEKYGKALWYCAPNLVPPAHGNPAIARYDEDKDAVLVFASIPEDTDEIINKTIEPLPYLIETAELQAVIRDAAKKTGIYEKLYIIAAEKAYKELGVFSSRGPVTVVQMCETVLNRRFPNGYKIADSADSLRFIEAMREFFGENAATTPHAIDTKIMDLGVLIDRGKYVHSDRFSVDRDIIDAINGYVDANPKSAIAYTEIYTALKDVFNGTMITNRYALQGAMKLYGCPYESHKDYIVKSGGEDMISELNSFVKAAGLVHKSEILKKFPGWKDSNLSLMLPRCPNIITAGKGYYIHSRLLIITEDDRRELLEYLNANITDIPVTSRYLHERLMRAMPEFMEKNDIENHEKLFGVLKYMFSDEYYFAHNFIAKKGMGNVTNHSVILMLLEGRDTVVLEDIIDICRRHSIHFLSMAYLADLIMPEFMRVGANLFIRAEKIGFRKEMYADIAAAINADTDAHGGYLSAIIVKDFSNYPKLNMPWTTFLLECAADMMPKKVAAVKMQAPASGMPHSIFARGEYVGLSWANLVLKALKTKHAAEPFKTKAEALEWLQSEGLCNTKYPAAIDSEDHIYLDENGNLRIE